MRSSGGTNFGLALSVVACTNSTIAFFAAPSFHEGRGSVSAIARTPAASNGMQTARVIQCLLTAPTALDFVRARISLSPTRQLVRSCRPDLRRAHGLGHAEEDHDPLAAAAGRERLLGIAEAAVDVLPVVHNPDVAGRSDREIGLQTAHTFHDDLLPHAGDVAVAAVASPFRRTAPSKERSVRPEPDNTFAASGRHVRAHGMPEGTSGIPCTSPRI